MRGLIIVGGGLAGLTAAIHVARAGHDVTVIEQKRYPQHKVCGEYISSEILPYFDRLGIPIRDWQPRRIERFRLHAPSGRWVESTLPLGGFGLRRFTLDERLYELARTLGVQFVLDTTVRRIAFGGDRFDVEADEWRDAAHVVIGSFGKRSNMDRILDRPLNRASADYVAVKFYIDADFPDDLVSLYTFRGGYAGAVKVEDGTVDVAYLTRSGPLRAHGGLEQLEQHILYQSPPLRDLLTAPRRADARRLTISNVSFAPKDQVRDHILMIGDAAGMIPPLCGNGMAMAVHAAKFAGEGSPARPSSLISAAGKAGRRWRRSFAGAGGVSSDVGCPGGGASIRSSVARSRRRSRWVRSVSSREPCPRSSVGPTAQRSRDDHVRRSIPRARDHG
jgi:flavin-dependent dehydrogenase